MHSFRAYPPAPIIALSALLMLSNCGVSGSKAKPAPSVDLEQTAAAAIPDLSSADAEPCSDPGVPSGVEALEIIATHRVALGDCRQRHGRVVEQYSSIKSILNPPKETLE